MTLLKSDLRDNVPGEISAITEKTTPVGDDVLLIEDSEDTYAKKKLKVSSLPGGGRGFTAHPSAGWHRFPRPEWLEGCWRSQLQSFGLHLHDLDAEVAGLHLGCLSSVRGEVVERDHFSSSRDDHHQHFSHAGAEEPGCHHDFRSQRLRAADTKCRR